MREQLKQVIELLDLKIEQAEPIKEKDSPDTYFRKEGKQDAYQDCINILNNAMGNVNS